MLITLTAAWLYLLSRRRPFRVRVEHQPVNAAPNRPLKVLGVMDVFGEPGGNVPAA